MVQKFIFEKSGVEKSGVEKFGLKKFMVEMSRVEKVRMYLQPHYGNGVFGNVYLSAGEDQEVKIAGTPLPSLGVVDKFGKIQG